MRDWASSLLPASYRGVPFWVEYESLSGGKRLAVHEHAGGQISKVEEMGRSTRAFDVTAYTVGDFADVQALALVSVLDMSGPGFLTLPIDVPMMASAESFSRSRSKTRNGYVGHNITFRPHPVFGGQGLSLGNVNAAVATGVAAAASGLAGLFS